MEQIIGIDLAKRIFQLHLVSQQGQIKANKLMTREKLMDFIVQQLPSRIVMEACRSANSRARQFRHYGRVLTSSGKLGRRLRVLWESVS